MNQISLLLYWGHVMGNLGGLFIFLGCVSMLVAVVTYIIHYITIAEFLDKVKYKGIDNDEGEATWLKHKPRLPFVILPFGFLLWIAAAFCPDQDTVYAIAASQLGEQALNTPLAGKAEKALEGWLDKQISPPAPTPAKGD